MGSTYASAVSVARSGPSPCTAVTRSRPPSLSPMLSPRADQLAGYARSLNIGALDGAARAGRGGTRRASGQAATGTLPTAAQPELHHGAAVGSVPVAA